MSIKCGYYYISFSYDDPCIHLDGRLLSHPYDFIFKNNGERAPLCPAGLSKCKPDLSWSGNYTVACFDIHPRIIDVPRSRNIRYAKGEGSSLFLCGGLQRDFAISACGA
jgi:hypothetical protein